MSREHIEQRLERYEQKRKQRERQDRLERRAIDAAPAMLEELRKRITENVVTSNEVFRDIHHSQCEVIGTDYGFAVVRSVGIGRLVLKLKRKQDSPFVDVEVRVDGAEPATITRPECLGQIEVRAEQTDGELQYVYDRKAYKAAKDTDNLAMVLLDLVLPGENDLR